MALKTLPVQSSLDRYQEQARLLIRAFNSNEPAALRFIRQHHPRLPGRPNTNDRNPVTPEFIHSVGVLPQDAEEVVARWHGFASWPDLERHLALLGTRDSLVLAFELAVEAIISGDLPKLESLLRKHPALIHARSTREHHATLLHYVGANGVEGFRQRTPANAVSIAACLLAAGAEVDADLHYGESGARSFPERVGSTTLGLVATSYHPAAAGVQLPLLDTLLRAGASIDGLPGGWNPLLAALHNGRGAAAAFLAKRGALLDLEGAAGSGQLKVVKSFFRKDGSLAAKANHRQMEAGFLWACEYGRTSVVRFLLDCGVDLTAQPRGETGLHWAAYGGHPQIVQLLLRRKAPLELPDERFGASPLGWALHGWCYPPPEATKADYYRVVSLLVKAGSNLDILKFLDHGQTKKLRTAPRMQKLLHPKMKKPVRRFKTSPGSNSRRAGD